MTSLSNYGGFSVPTPVAQGTPASAANRIPSRSPATPPVWGVNFLRDLFYREDVRQAVLEEYFNMNTFVSSGILQRNAELDGRQGGVTVEYPFFQQMVFEEEDIDSNEYWGNSHQGYLTPQRTQTSKFTIPRVSKGFAFGADDISRIASGEDPMAAMSSYIAGNLQTFRTRHILALLDAAFGTGGPLVDQKYTAAAPAGAVPLAAESISVTQVVEALNLMGERSSRINSIAMHSSLYHWLLHQGLLQFSSPAGVGTSSAIEWGGGGVGVTNAAVQYFAGLRVVVCDQIVPVPGGTGGTAKVYPAYLFADGAIQEGIQKEFSLEFDRNILSKQDIASCSYVWAIGIPGISWTGTPASIPQDSGGAGLPPVTWTPTYPRLTDLAIPTNWSLAWSNRQYVPIVRMDCYSPFGGTY